MGLFHRRQARTAVRAYIRKPPATSGQTWFRHAKKTRRRDRPVDVLVHATQNSNAAIAHFPIILLEREEPRNMCTGIRQSPSAGLDFGTAGGLEGQLLVFWSCSRDEDGSAVA
jgi:hypothetical protein